VIKVPNVDFHPEPPPGMPDHVYIMGERIEVKYSDNLLKDRDAYGVEILKDGLIVIDTDVSEDHMRRVLTHEILHACFGLVDVHGMNGEQEEIVVRALSAGLHSALKSNDPWWE